MPAKIKGDSLLIHEFTHSLFVGPCSVISNMTGYSHSYHSIKLIHCITPQRDVLSDKMVFWVVTHSSYFMLCQSYLLLDTVTVWSQGMQDHFGAKSVNWLAGWPTGWLYGLSTSFPISWTLARQNPGTRLRLFWLVCWLDLSTTVKKNALMHM